MSNYRRAVAVVGCGYWGQNLVRNFNELEALSMSCDATDQGRERARELAPGATVVASLDEVLSSPVTAVVVATPAATHYDIAKRALEAGKDVFVEKPLALTYDEGSDLASIADREGLILMVGHVLEYHPNVVRLKELATSGELGEVQYIYSNRLNLGKVRQEENILWSFAPHDIAVILSVLQRMPFQVSAVGGSYLQPNIPDTTVTHLLFDRGVRAHVYVSWLHPFKEQRLVVVGSRKMATFDDVAKELVIYDQHFEFHAGKPSPVKAEGVRVPPVTAEPLRIECEAFLDAILTRVSPLTDARSGLRVLKVLQAAQQSLIMNGEAVCLPFDTSTARRRGDGRHAVIG